MLATTFLYIDWQELLQWVRKWKGMGRYQQAAETCCLLVPPHSLALPQFNVADEF